jgi:hypothetical protein
MPWDEAALEQVRGATVVAGGDEVGSVEEVFAFAGADAPAVARVSSAGGTVLVPLADGEADGSRVTVPYDAEQVKAAPAASGDALTEDEFEAVYAHYGISDATQRSQSQP